MNRNKEVERLLHQLREAIDEAIAESLGVLAAMSELEDAGFGATYSVEISLPEKVEPVSVEAVIVAEKLLLTGSDEHFLQSLGITTPML